ncbi:MAG: GGDEF domain-containing protein, partial [Tepidisphaeraceae bacterium]
MMSVEPQVVAWWWQAGMALAIVVICGLTAWRHQRHWLEPARELADLLPQVRIGEAPVDDLARRVGGGLAPLVPTIQDLLRELRQQRSALASLNEELRQRVAQRTDKLERTVNVLRQQATHDPLTGLYNRRALDLMLPELLARRRAATASGASGTLCLLMIDVDHFKVLNDTLGHATGDAFLRSVGQLIRSSIRPNDAAFRCGGDEMVILLTDTDRKGAATLAQRVRELTDALAKTLRVTPKPALSVGVATLSDVSQATPEALLEEADRRLYDVKQARKVRPTRVAGAA